LGFWEDKGSAFHRVLGLGWWGHCPCIYTLDLLHTACVGVGCHSVMITNAWAKSTCKEQRTHSFGGCSSLLAGVLLFDLWQGNASWLGGCGSKTVAKEQKREGGRDWGAIVFFKGTPLKSKLPPSRPQFFSFLFLFFFFFWQEDSRQGAISYLNGGRWGPGALHLLGRWSTSALWFWLFWRQAGLDHHPLTYPSQMSHYTCVTRPRCW
jgi:hypothetical protein